MSKSRKDQRKHRGKVSDQKGQAEHAKREKRRNKRARQQSAAQREIDRAQGARG